MPDATPAATPAPAPEPAATPAVPGAAPAPAGTPPGAAPGAVPAARPNVLAAATAETPAEHFGIPEKHRVFKPDGTLDMEASTANVAKAYNERETQLGKLGKAPTSPGDYKLELPKGFEHEFKTEDFAEFMKEAHAAGVTQSQMDVVSKNFFSYADKLINGKLELEQGECDAALAKVWSQADRGPNFVSAKRALDTFGGERAQELLTKYGNDPDMIWFAANVGKQLKESSSLPPAGTGATAPSDGMAQVIKDLGSSDPAVRSRAEAAWSQHQKSIATRS